MKISIKPSIPFIAIFLVMVALSTKGTAQEKFVKSAFYEVMSTGDVAATDAEIIVVQNSTSANKEGYEGALLMKKAGLMNGPAKKLKFFKEGRIQLETAIMADNDNTEYHFLRLAIEEHAPKIVKYHADIERDKAIIIKNYKNLSPSVQKAILDYCKNSSVLHAEDF